MARLTSAIFVSAMMRQVMSQGGFAAILRKGAQEAGAVYIIVRERSNDVVLYGPAPQHLYDDERPNARLFAKVERVVSDMDVHDFTEKESRFDPDFWLVELETDAMSNPLPFEIMTL
jgi:hypothetical protein